MLTFVKNHQTVLGLSGFIVSAAVATIYLFVVPEETANAKGVLAVALAYAHPACWAFLAIASLLFAVKAPKQLITFIGLLALVCYGLFMYALFLV